MRHLKAGRALGVSPAHRRAMLRNLVTSLLEHQKIKTTTARAKELRTPLDKMVTLGKKGDLNSRRKALAFVKSKAAMAALFGEYAERYADRAGGFTRIIHLGPRKGDGAEMSMVIMVDGPNDPFGGETKPKKKAGKKAKKVTEAVAEKISEEKAAKEETAEVEANADVQVEAEAPVETAPAEVADEPPKTEAAAPQEGDEKPSEDEAKK